LILLDRIGIMPHHFIEVMVATLRLVWQGACGTAHAPATSIPCSWNTCSAMSKPIVVACSRTPPSVAVRHRRETDDVKSVEIVEIEPALGEAA
jgi:hypothetical protein